jgi:hypothetical protein
MTNLETGESYRFTYLNMWTRQRSDLHRSVRCQRMLDWLDGALPIGEPDIVTDPGMMFGSAEFTCYELDVTA